MDLNKLNKSEKIEKINEAKEKTKNTWELKFLENIKQEIIKEEWSPLTPKQREVLSKILNKYCEQQTIIIEE